MLALKETAERVLWELFLFSLFLFLFNVLKPEYLEEI